MLTGKYRYSSINRQYCPLGICDVLIGRLPTAPRDVGSQFLVFVIELSPRVDVLVLNLTA